MVMNAEIQTTPTAQQAGQVDPYGEAASYGVAQPPAGGAPVDMFDLRALLRVLRASKFLIVALVGLASAAAVLLADRLTPLYSAGVVILVEPDRRNIVDIDRVAEGLVTTDDQTIQTEADLMQSRGLARQVVQHLGLINDPVWNPFIVVEAPEPIQPSRAGFARDVFDQTYDRVTEFLFGPPVEVEFAPPPPEVLLDQIARRFQGNVSVIAGRDSRIITLEVESPDPEFAARAANATAEIYIESQRADKGTTTNQAAAWLQQRVDETQDRLIDADRRLEQFRRDSGLTTVGTSILPAQQLVEFSSELSRARADWSFATARHDQVKELLAGATAGDSGDFAAAAPVLESSLIQSLRVQEVQLNRRLAELRTKFREGHPDIGLARAELDDLRGDITAEIAKIAASLGNEAELARARVNGLETEVANRQTALDDLTASEVTLRALQSEADASRALFETLLQRLKETGVQDETLQRPDIRIVDAAVIPSFPFFPRKKVIVAMAFASSLGLSVLFVLVREFLHPGFRGVAQLQSATGRPVLGLLPRLGRRARARALKPGRAAARDPQVHMYAEALRTLRTNLMVLNGGQLPGIVMVTSSVPDEGKTSTALAAAAQAADAGRRVIVVECDFRNATFGARVGALADTLGLADYLLGEDVEVSDIVGHHEGTNVSYIVAGGLPNQPADVLAGPAMDELLDTLRYQYDLVILDTPPLLAVADATMLMRAVDAVVYLVRWEKTQRSQVQAGLRMVADAGAPTVGLAMSRVNVRKHALYADGGALTLDKTYQNYYMGAAAR